MRFSIHIFKPYKILKMYVSAIEIKLFSKKLPKFMKRSERPGFSRHEYFVLLFLHELMLNHALQVRGLTSLRGVNYFTPLKEG